MVLFVTPGKLFFGDLCATKDGFIKTSFGLNLVHSIWSRGDRRKRKGKKLFLP